jgi:pyruvate/2-oxoglutarate dehydrogenase complex dihydrolipoamide dehydrogenase (E3) component
MSTERYDLVVIGGGSGGLTSAIMAGGLGARVLLVDKTSLGGDCLHYGCVPSKALIASARLAHQMRNAERWGLQSAEPQVDISKVMARIQAIKDDVAETESLAVLAEHGVEVSFGGARFVDQRSVDQRSVNAHCIAVGEERRVHAEHVVIATGSHARAPHIDGLEEAGYINHVSIFHLDALPRRLAVIGGGPIGCELGQALSRFGSHVTILQRGERLLAREEPEISATLLRAFEAEGIDVRCDENAARVERQADGKAVLLDSGERIVCDEILVAVGRAASIGSLDLDAAGIEHNERGIVVNDALQTSVAKIYAVGDCNGGPQFTHWAEYEARIATRNALFVGSSKRTDRVLPRVTFTDPQVASVGKTLADAQSSDPRAHTHRTAFSSVDRAVCESAPEGFLSVVADKKDRILGAHAIGIDAGELLAELVLAMEHDLTLSDVGEAIHAYPTFTRANRRVADQRFFDHGLPNWMTKLFGRFSPRAD